MSLFPKYEETLTRFVYIIGGLALVSSTVTAFITELRRSGPILWISLCILAVCLAFALYVRYQKRKLPQEISPNAAEKKANNIRGAQPFQIGQKLIGRDPEIRRLLTILEDPQFRFGYISGEAGSGKTSLVRAGLIKHMEQNGWDVYYFESAFDIINPDFSAEAGVDTLFLKNPLARLAERLNEKPKLLVIDQFEEFFLSRTSKLDRSTLGEGLAKSIEQYNIRVILCLRKEFVEELRNLAPHIKNPKADERSVYVENWETQEAAIYFKVMCSEDNVRFSYQLQEALIEDVAINRRVRPVELQIVAMYCVESEFEQLDDFNAAGRSRQILATFISKKLENTHTDYPEAEKTIGRYILRHLCSNGFDAKRADGGASFDQLYQEVKNTLSISAPGLSVQLQLLFPAILKQLVEDKLVSLGKNGKYNLYHDYLAKGVKKLGANLQSTAEIAHDMTTRYLERQGAGFFVLLSPKQYLFLRKNLSPGEYGRTDVRKFINGQKHSYIRYAVITSILLLTLLVYLSPPKVKMGEMEEISKYDYYSHHPTAQQQGQHFITLNDTIFRARLSSEGRDLYRIDLYYPIPYRENDTSYRPKDSIFRKIVLPYPGSVTFDGKLITMIDTAVQFVEMFEFNNGELVLLKQMKLPHLSNAERSILLLNKYGLMDDLKIHHIDTANKLFVAAFPGGILYSSNYDRDTIAKISIPNKSGYSSLNVGNQILFSSHSDSGSIYRLEKDSALKKADDDILELFQSRNLSYDYTGKYLILYEPENHILQLHRTFIPLHVAELGHPLGKIKLTYPPAPDPYLNINYFTQRQEFHIIKEIGDNQFVVKVNESNDFRLVYTNGTSNIELLRGSAWLNSFEGSQTKNNIYAYIYGPYSSTKRGIIKLKKGSNQLTFDNYDIISLGPEDSATLELCYIDSKHNLRHAFYHKDGNWMETKSILASISGDAGSTYWSEDNKYLYYRSDYELFFGKKNAALDRVAIIEGNEQINKVNEFYTYNSNLFIRSNQTFYQIKRYQTLWGIRLWELEWPPVKISLPIMI